MNDTQANLSIAELEARLVLYHIPSIGTKRFKQLIQFFGSAQSALQSQSQWKQAGLPAHCQTTTILKKDSITSTLDWLMQNNHHVIFWDQPNYPALLKELIDAPPLLFVTGNLVILEQPQIAIVGSRHASKPGLETAYQFAKTLANMGFVISSGLALGIDSAAHKGALSAASGLTVGVLGSGLCNIYPTTHKKLAQEIINQGGSLISEFPLNATPQANNFPRRNRIISGLSLGVLVVEATVSSGSLITAKLAAEQGREVFAIPGSIHHPAAKGCHQLIREGALLVETVEHILEALKGWQNINPATEPTITLASSSHTDPIIAALYAAPQTSESLAQAINMPFEQLLTHLTELEIDGKISCCAGIWHAH